MKQLLCFLPWLLLTLVVSSHFSEARFVVEKNSLSVTSPESIKGTHDSAIGNFGIPQYGGSMAGTVVYPKENQKSCKEFSDFSISFKSQPGALPTFLLVDRGDCFFALKVWNAQKAGASAVLVADNVDEPLITMDTPEEDISSAKYIENITIPSALVTKGFGEKLKKAISGGDMVNLNLDWREAVPHPDDRVEYELWTNSNDECGVKCDMLMEFVKDFKGAAQILEKGGFTQFRPHYITWYCPHAFTLSRQCKSQCINKGRYCAPDPEQDFSSGYDGKDVVVENLRQLCVFKVANETGKPWVWWDYVTDFQIRCPMKEKKYNRDCAESVIKSLGIDSKKIDKCMGDPDADMDNPVLKEEQDAQVGKGSRGDVTILPTLVVNNRQYRGKLEKSAVLKALCSGFEESTEPAICLSTDMETNECLDNNGGCWQDKSANITACKDTFRGKVCVCPIVDGVRFKGDGYSHCEPSGPGRCTINNGGCWHEERDGHAFSACVDKESVKCECPPGFKGDGIKKCEDINECKEKKACQCPECSCKNTWGSYECSCSGDLLYMRDHDTCINCFFALKVWNAQKAGASAVLVADNVDEPLITMDTPEEDVSSAKYIENITIPSALVTKGFGEKLKKAISGGDMVNLNLDWREAVPHPDDRVEYELWTNSNDECGVKCDMLMEFVKDFKGAAQILEKGGFTQFRPHYITWYCPHAFTLSKQCKSQCINKGRYCAPDPEQDFSSGYDGKDVVVENLRQLCVFKVANETGKPWVWWDYVTDFQIRCPMKEKKYNKDCADSVIKSLGIDSKKLDKCMGDPDADKDNPVLKEEQDAQVGKGSRGDVTILPTLVVNNRQYRGKLEKSAVLKALCSGFEETTEPAICLSTDVESNECLDNNGGCWQDKSANITACKDTFRGRVCECPRVDGVLFKGDGYSHCEPSGPGRCTINNGGCWHEERDGHAFSACVDKDSVKCECPPGFKGDGIKKCEDINECKEKKACQCPECSCKNTWGSYECSCSGDLLYIRDHDTCISKTGAQVKSAWAAVWLIMLSLGLAAAGAYLVYKYRLRRYMDSEIRAIMAQYMPLDSQPEVPNHVNDERA